MTLPDERFRALKAGKNYWKNYVIRARHHGYQA